MQELKEKIQKLLGKEITQFELKGKGAVNNAYYIETIDGGKYIVKEELEVKEFQPENNLVVEARVIQDLSSKDISIALPNVVFVSENPQMYGYEYIEGEMMKGVWDSLTEDEKMDICTQLGKFHSEIGKKISKGEAENLGLTIDLSTDIHPENLKDYEAILSMEDAPEEWKVLARKAREILDQMMTKVVFHFIHNDSHHENIILKDKKIAGIIDFGNAEYGEVTKEFSRYIRDFPNHFEYIVSSYEKESGNKLSRERLMVYSFLSGLIDNVENYRKGGEDKARAENSFSAYKSFLASLSI